jgi:hypothetical protein
MKLLILLLPLTVFAQYKIEITPSDSKYAKMKLDCTSTENCNEELLKFVKRTSLKGEWKADALGSIVSETYMDEEMQEQTRYYVPTNFTIQQVDITNELQQKEIEKAIKKNFDCGEKAIRHIAKLNVAKQLNKGQRKQMINSYAEILNILKSGAVDIAIDEINSVNADGTIVTANDKTSIVNYIQGCLND